MLESGKGEVERTEVAMSEAVRGWTDAAEQELASSNDIFDDRHKVVGRNKMKFVWKPVLGWRSREK